MFNSKLLIILLVLVSITFIQIISNHKKSENRIEFESSQVRPSYGNEFYNYYGGENKDKNNTEKIKDNIQEIIVEGFSFENDEMAIKETHITCPVMEGNRAEITDCIQFPNNRIEGLPGSVNEGFLISVCCSFCIDKIQSSFNNNDGTYNIIYENNHYILTKNGENKQVVFPCDPEKKEQIIRIRDENQR